MFSGSRESNFKCNHHKRSNFTAKFEFITSLIMASFTVGSGLDAGLIYLVLPAFLAFAYYFSSRSKLYPGFPLAGTGAQGFFGSLDEARKQWAEHGPSILQQGLKKVDLLTRVPRRVRKCLLYDVQVSRLLPGSHDGWSQNRPAREICKRDPE